MLFNLLLLLLLFQFNVNPITMNKSSSTDSLMLAQKPQIKCHLVTLLEKYKKYKRYISQLSHFSVCE